MRHIMVCLIVVLCVMLFTGCCGCKDKQGPAIEKNSADQQPVINSTDAATNTNMASSNLSTSTNNSQSTNDCGCGK